MTDLLANAIIAQSPRPLTYVEPFAGGAGAALQLLYREVVDHVHLNDLNPGISEFWRRVFHDTNSLISRIVGVKPTLDEWHRQRDLYSSGEATGLDLAYAVFFLNRTNRSGILGARPIGGLEQDGRWKIDARYNAPALARRVEMLGNYRHRVEVTEQDGRELILEMAERGTEVFLYVDPPYLVQGDELYMNTLAWSDHVRLAQDLVVGPPYWLLTYDQDARVVEELYPKNPAASFSISHTAARQHIGSEYLIASNGLRLANLEGVSGRSVEWLDGRAPVSCR